MLKGSVAITSNIIIEFESRIQGKWACKESFSLFWQMNNVTNQRGYSQLLLFFSWWLIFFLCADSWTVWNCNLNVLIFLVSDLSADWHHFFSIYFNLHPTLCLTWEDTHAVICQNVFDIEETNVFMGQYSMVYYLLILFVYLVSQLMMGMIRWCFYQNPESAMFKRFQSCWLYLTFSFSMLSVCTFPLRCIYFHRTATCGALSFLLGCSQPGGSLLKDFGWIIAKMLFLVIKPS